MGQLCVSEGKVAHVVCIEGKVPDRSLLHPVQRCFPVSSKAPGFIGCASSLMASFTRAFCSGTATKTHSIKPSTARTGTHTRAIILHCVIVSRGLTVVVCFVQGLQVPPTAGTWRSYADSFSSFEPPHRFGNCSHGCWLFFLMDIE